MTRAIAEADWKVLRRVRPLALERYCERVLAELGHDYRDLAVARRIVNLAARLRRDESDRATKYH